MRPLLSRFLRTPIVKALAFGGLALTVGYALAQQMVEPQTKPPGDKEVAARKSKGGYYPERMKNPNLSGHASRMTVTPPSE
ncbi:MAG: hypothetical protein ACRD3R_17035, partial [Terriglobales bacterium]